MIPAVVYLPVSSWTRCRLSRARSNNAAAGAALPRQLHAHVRLHAESAAPGWQQSGRRAATEQRTPESAVHLGPSTWSTTGVLRPEPVTTAAVRRVCMLVCATRSARARAVVAAHCLQIAALCAYSHCHCAYRPLCLGMYGSRAAVIKRKTTPTQQCTAPAPPQTEARSRPSR